MLPPQPAATLPGGSQPASPSPLQPSPHRNSARLFTTAASPVLLFPQPPHSRHPRLPTAAFPVSPAPARPPGPARPRGTGPHRHPVRGGGGLGRWQPASEEVMEAEGGGRAGAGKRGGRAIGSSPAAWPPPLPRLSPHAASSRRPPPLASSPFRCCPHAGPAAHPQRLDAVPGCRTARPGSPGAPPAPAPASCEETAASPPHRRRRPEMAGSPRHRGQAFQKAAETP